MIASLLIYNSWAQTSYLLIFGVEGFEVGELFGVCCFVVDICDDLAIYVFYKDV